MVTITCHCKNIQITFKKLPNYVRDCDCPMCNRLGALWADFDSNEIKIKVKSKTITYQWGKGEYEMHHCHHCGCSTHYSSFEENNDEIGVNLRMLDRSLLEQIPIKLN